MGYSLITIAIMELDHLISVEKSLNQQKISFVGFIYWPSTLCLSYFHSSSTTFQLYYYYTNHFYLWDPIYILSDRTIALIRIFKSN